MKLSITLLHILHKIKENEQVLLPSRVCEPQKKRGCLQHNKLHMCIRGQNIVQGTASAFA